MHHPTPDKPQFSPHDHAPFTYLKKGQRQLATEPDLTPLLTDKKDIQRVQSIIGSLLYYGRTLDNTILPALNELSITQSKPTVKTLQKCKKLLDYVATYPNVYLRFYASDMNL